MVLKLSIMLQLYHPSTRAPQGPPCHSNPLDPYVLCSPMPRAPCQSDACTQHPIPSCHPQHPHATLATPMCSQQHHATPRCHPQMPSPAPSYAPRRAHNRAGNTLYTLAGSHSARRPRLLSDALALCMGNRAWAWEHGTWNTGVTDGRHTAQET